MFCIKCGNPIPEQARFCPSCGTPVYRTEIMPEDSEQSPAQIPLEIPEEVKQNLKEAVAEIMEQPIENVEQADIESDDLNTDSFYDTEESSLIGDVDPGNAAASLLESALVLDSVSRNVVPDEIFPAETGGQYAEMGPVLDLSLEEPVKSNTVSDETEGILSVAEVSLPAAETESDTAQKISAELPEGQAEPDIQTIPSAYVHSWENNQSSSGSGKAKKWAFLLLILALIGTVIGYVIHVNSPSVKYKKAMGMAEDLFTEENYELAKEKYLQAMTIQYDKEAEDGYFRCTDILAEEAYGRNDYRSAVRLYRDSKEYCPNYVVTADEYIKLIYSDWILNTAEEGELAEATLLLQEAETWGYDMANERSILDSKLAEAAVYQRGVVIAEVLASYIDNEENDKLFEYIRDTANPFFDELYESGVAFPVVYEMPLTSGHTYEKAGFFLDGGYYVYYYGGFQEEVRDGYGTCVVLLENSSGAYRQYTASGEWSEGAPNGTFRENMYTMFSDGTTERVLITSNVHNGLYDGEVTYDYEDDDIYYATFENGKVVVIDTVDPNGKESNVIAYNADRSAWIFRRDDAAESLEGIIGFEE